MAISLRIDNGTCFYTMSYQVKTVFLWRSPALPAGNHPQCPRLTPDVTTSLQPEPGICMCFFYLKKVDFLVVNLTHLRKEGLFFSCILRVIRWRFMPEAHGDSSGWLVAL